MPPGEPIVLENAQRLIYDLFFNNRRYDLGQVGRDKLNKRLELSSDQLVITRDDLVAPVSYLIALQNGQGKIDDIDHLANRRVRRVGELVSQTAFRDGLLRLERAIKEKMSLVSTEELVTPADTGDESLSAKFFGHNRHGQNVFTSGTQFNRGIPANHAAPRR